MVAAARLMVQGTDALVCPPYLRDAAAAMAGVGYVQLGEPGNALMFLEGRTSTPDHSVCFEQMRASAYLQLGKYRKAISCTDPCVSGNPDHSIVTLVSVLLRRAVAFDALGHHATADADFSTAAHLAMDNDLVAGVLGLPATSLRTLLSRMAATDPVFAAQVVDQFPRGQELAELPQVGFASAQLTPREKVIARWLHTEKTLPEIAVELHVSINTVKSQVGGLYRKLGVASRDDATVMLRRIGHSPPPG